jgi:hypothetical protein
MDGGVDIYDEEILAPAVPHMVLNSTNDEVVNKLWRSESVGESGWCKLVMIQTFRTVLVQFCGLLYWIGMTHQL